MTRLSQFNNPFLLGFDEIERLLETISQSGNEGYPPYNIEHCGDRALRITIAVAGFSVDDLSVTVEDNQLTIRGKRDGRGDDGTYLHRGIATRQFQRKFILAEGMTVSGAELANGLLSINLTRPDPVSRVHSIPIQAGDISGEETTDE